MGGIISIQVRVVIIQARVVIDNVINMSFHFIVHVYVKLQNLTENLLKPVQLQKPALTNREPLKTL